MKLNNFLIFIICLALSTKSAQGFYDYEQLVTLSGSEVYESQEWKDLLHYDGSQSVINSGSNFFLSPTGHHNPKAEYISTLKALTDDKEQGDNHAICRYPARFDYILNKLNLSKEKFPKVQCKAYQEYLDKVPFDKVAVVFAAENNISPSSMMGHSFLKISGNNESGYKEHSFSYFASMDKTASLKFYVDVMTIGIDGAYILSPYREKENDYLYGEKRSLWEFNLEMNQTEKMKLKQHLWELKGSNIRYSLLSHNCNTAIISILKTANSNFATESIKPFVTPVEYIQELHQKQRISSIDVAPTYYNREKINKFGVKSLLDASKNSRIELSYNSAKKDYGKIKISPVYQDIKDINNGYFDEMESKIGEIALAYSSKNKIFLQSVDVLKMRSILDYSIQQDYSKHFKLSFENSLEQYNTALKPTLEFGLGYGTYNKMLAFYIIPRLGWRYNHYSNFYVAPEIGTIMKLFDTTKLMASYEHYFNSRGNNRGYNGKYNLYMGQELVKNIDLYTEYSYYIDSHYKHSISIGLSYRF